MRDDPVPGRAKRRTRRRAARRGTALGLAAAPAARGGPDRRRFGRGDHESDGGGAGGVFRPEGDDARVFHDPALYEMESPHESRGTRDDERPVAWTPAVRASRPLADGGCPMSGNT